MTSSCLICLCVLFSRLDGSLHFADLSQFSGSSTACSGDHLFINNFCPDGVLPYWPYVQHVRHSSEVRKDINQLGQNYGASKYNSLWIDRIMYDLPWIMIFGHEGGDLPMIFMSDVLANYSFMHLNYWGRDKIGAISQTIFSSAFSWMKIFEFRLKFHRSLFQRVQLIISQHWFRLWLGVVGASRGLNELTDEPGQDDHRPLISPPLSPKATSMMTSSNGTISALLAICAGNSPVTGEFPAQRPVTRNCDVIFDLCLNKRLSKHWWGWWFETPSCPLWR